MILNIFIHELNECLTLWVSDTENYLYDMDEEYTFSKDVEGISTDIDSIKPDKKRPDFC